MTDVLVFAAGIAGLLVAANLVVSGASQIGIRFGLSPAVVGLTILAFGTSAPELAVVGQSVAADDTELAVGGIIGSNIANILLVVGLIAALRAIRVQSRVVTTDVPIMIGASVLFLVFALDSVIERWEALVLLVGIVAFTVWTIRSTRGGSSLEEYGADGPEDPDEAAGRPPRTDTRPIPLLAGQVLVGIVGLALAANVVVGAAENIATDLGVPELIVGLTIVALGTSAPEIVTSVVAATRGQADLAVGNAFGSNIFNIMFVLGAVGLVSPRGIAISEEALALDLPVMLAAAVACIPVLVTDHILRRWEGLVFLAYYAAYIAFLVLDSADHDASDDLVRYVGWIAIPLTVITFATVAVRHLRRGSVSSS
jgi:cation:H+ antiporter